MSDEPLEWRIQILRGQLVELGSAVLQLNQSGLDSAPAQLLLSRKRAELEDLMQRGRCQTRCNGTTTTRTIRPGWRRAAPTRAVVLRGVPFTVSTDSAHIIAACSSA